MTKAINWSQVDTVLFDMDGTLLDLHYDNYFWQEHVPLVWGQREGLSAEQAKLALHPHFEQQYGNLQWYCTDYWAELLKLDVLALKHDLRDMIKTRPAVEAVLRWLRQQGKALWIATNAHGDVLSLKMAETGLAEWFEHLITSHQFGYPKEHQAFWQALQQAFPFDPKRTVFFDDSVPVLKAAQTFGVRYVVQMQHPDSQREANSAQFDLAIHHFDELLPKSAL